MKFMILAAALILTVSGEASAQSSGPALQGRLKHGKKVAITDDRGNSIRGRVADAGADFVTLSRSGDRFDIKYSDIVVIEKVDDVKNGAMIGLLVGAGLFVADVWVSSQDGITLNPAGYAVFAALYGGLGAGAGAGLDALIGGNRTIFKRGETARISMAPNVGPHRAGARIAVSW